MNSVPFWIYYIFYELFTSQMAKQDKRHKTASTGACSRCTPPQHYPPHLYFEPPVEPKLPLQMQKLQLSPSLHIPSVGVADDPNASNANFTNPAPIPKNNSIKKSPHRFFSCPMRTVNDRMLNWASPTASGTSFIKAAIVTSTRMQHERDDSEWNIIQWHHLFCECNNSSSNRH